MISERPKTSFKKENSKLKRLVIKLVAQLRKVYYFCRRFANLPNSYGKYVKNAVTYYPELPHKSKLRLWWDYAVWVLRTGDEGLFFRAYGFDIKGHNADPDVFVDEDFFWHKIVPLAYEGNANYAVVLRDKSLFDMYMRAFDIPSPQLLAYANESGFYVKGKKLAFTDWITHLASNYKEFFLKGTMSCCGRDVWHVVVKNGKMTSDGKPFEPTEGMLSGQKLVVQQKISNCKEIANINPYAVSTVRMVTVMGRKSRRPKLLCPGYIRIGCVKESSVDNLCAGGVGVGIKDDGTLMEYGLFKPWIGKLKCYEHPISGVKFAGFRLPYYKEACELVKRAHMAIPNVPDDGPTLIEGNDNWEISGVQIPHGGVKKRLLELLES